MKHYFNDPIEEITFLFERMTQAERDYLMWYAENLVGSKGYIDDLP